MLLKFPGTRFHEISFSVSRYTNMKKQIHEIQTYTRTRMAKIIGVLLEYYVKKEVFFFFFAA